MLFFPSLAEERKEVYRIQDIPNVQLYDSTRFVSDPEGYLSSAMRVRLDQKLLMFRQDLGVEMVVVVVPSIGEAPIEGFALELLRSWGVGSSKQNSGIVLLAAIEDRLFRVETGYGMEGVLPDATAISIFSNYVKEPFREGNYDEGIEGAVLAIIKTVQEGDFDSAERTDTPGALIRQGLPSTKKILLWGLGILGVLLFISALASVNVRDNSRKGPYTLERKDTAVIRWSIVLFIIAFPFALLLLLWYYAYYRRHVARISQRCPACLRQTFEKKSIYTPEVRPLITPSQHCEQRLGSVRYGGAVCSECGYTALYKVSVPHSRYKRCPSCKTRAYYKVEEKEIYKKGRRYIRSFYQCKYCDYHNTEDIKDDTSDAKTFAAGMIIGSMLGGRSSRGGGFSGGGFGGGSGGGGGATGQW